MQVNTEKTELALQAASNEVSLFVKNAEAEVSALEEQYASLLPDATTKKGYDDCKAVRRELMPIKSGLENARKTLKAPILAAGKLVDSTMNPLAERVEALYKPFESAYRAVDEEKKLREQRRQEKIQEGFEQITNAVITASGSTSTVIQAVIDDLADFSIDPDVFMEKTEQAASAHSETMIKLGEMLIQAINFEEMEAKQKEIEKREQAIREKELEQERKEIEEQEKQKAIQREKEMQKAREEAAKQAEEAAKIRHEQELKEAEERAKAKAEEAARLERERIEEEQSEEKRQEAIREKNKKHKADIHNAILKEICSTGITEEQGKAIITLAAKRKAANLFIQY